MHPHPLLYTSAIFFRSAALSQAPLPSGVLLREPVVPAAKRLVAATAKLPRRIDVLSDSAAISFHECEKGGDFEGAAPFVLDCMGQLVGSKNVKMAELLDFVSRALRKKTMIRTPETYSMMEVLRLADLGMIESNGVSLIFTNEALGFGLQLEGFYIQCMDEYVGLLDVALAEAV